MVGELTSTHKADWIREIDGLRGISVTLVLLYHLGLFSYGYLGVDIFFVISGFVITHASLKKWSSFSFANFYRARFRRLFPPLLIMLGLTIPIFSFLLRDSEWEDTLSAVPYTLVFASNWFFLNRDYFAPETSGNPLLHTWSLGVEEQFYLIFPLLFLILRRFSRAASIATVAFLAVLSLIFWVRVTAFFPEAAFFNPLLRAWQILFGVVGAYLFSWGANSFGKPLALAMAIAAGAFFYEGNDTLGKICLTFGTVGLLLVSNAPPTSSFLAIRPLRYLGRISYGVYLYHYPIFLLVDNAFEPFAGNSLVKVTLTFILAVFSYHAIEEYAIGRKRGPLFPRGLRDLRWRSGFVLVAMTAVIMLAGLFNSSRADRMSVWGTSFTELSEEAASTKGLGRDCTSTRTPRTECVFGEGKSVLVWGDSFAQHLVPAIQRSGTSVRIIQMAQGRCAPVLGVALGDRGQAHADLCILRNQATLDFIRSSEEPQVVVMGSLWRLLDNKSFVVDSLGRPVSEEAILSRLALTISNIRDAGSAVVFVLPPPSGPFDVGKCAVELKLRGQVNSGSCDFSFFDDGSRLKNSKLIDSINDVAFLDLSGANCDKEICRAFLDETSIYFDNRHYSQGGSEKIGELFDLAGALLRASKYSSGEIIQLADFRQSLP